MEITFENNSRSKRLRSMLAVDMRRIFTMPLLYIMAGISLAIPILILVMTTMMDGSVTVDPNTSVETVMEGFDNTWQILGNMSGEGPGMDMSLTGMCNINMLYFLIAVLVCIFVSDDFRSGYSKNLFTARAVKSDYVISKSVVGFIGGAIMIMCFFVGAVLGGVFSSLSFDTGAAGISGIVTCLISKMMLVGIFVPIYLLMSVIFKGRLWLSVLLSFGVGMLLYNVVPMLSPLNSTVANVLICSLTGVIFSVGLGALSNVILKKTSLV